jgi:hypothetical protein
VPTIGNQYAVRDCGYIFVLSRFKERRQCNRNGKINDQIIQSNLVPITQDSLREVKRLRRLQKVLVLLGFVYSVAATKYSYALRLSPHILALDFPLERLIIGPLWPVVLLPPVTIGTAILRVGFPKGVLILFAASLVMVATEYQVQDFWHLAIVTGTIFVDVGGLFYCVAVQLPLWGLVAAIVKAVVDRSTKLKPIER